MYQQRPNPWKWLAIMIPIMGCMIVSVLVYMSVRKPQAETEQKWYAYTPTPKVTKTPAVTDVPPTSTLMPSITPTVPDYEDTQACLEGTMQAVKDAQATETERARQNMLLQTQIPLQETLTVVEEQAKESAHQNDLRRSEEKSMAKIAEQQAQDRAEYERLMLQEKLESERQKNDTENQERQDAAQRKDAFWDGITVVGFIFVVAAFAVMLVAVVKATRIALDRSKADQFNEMIAHNQEERTERQNKAIQRYLAERALVTDLVRAVIQANPKSANDNVIPRYDKINMSSDKRQKAVEVLVRYGLATVDVGIGTTITGTVGELAQEIRMGDFPTLTPTIARYLGKLPEQYNTPNSAEHPGTPLEDEFYTDEQGNQKRLP